MANVIRHKRGTSDPVAGDFSNTAELLVNTTDGGLFTKTDGGSVVEIGAGGGLTEFVESQDTASPNATVPVDALTATDASYTNIDVALVPKGTGAFLAEVPDGAVAGGNKRGANAVDLQTDRNNSIQVASGANSVVVGGERNTASAGHSTVLGGFSNTASGLYSIAGGYSCSATGANGVVIGYNSTSSTSYGAVIGYENSLTANYGHIVGSYHTVSASYAACMGGISNTADAELSIVIGARDGDTRSTVGKAVIPACKSPIAFGDGLTQSAILVLGRQTTDATTTTLASNTSTPGATNQLFLDNNTAYYFKGSVIAGVTGAGDTKAWTFEGAIKRGASAATTAIVGSVVLNTIAYDSGAAAWDVDITADTTNGCLKVEVTGAAATTIRWVAKLETTEMGF